MGLVNVQEGYNFLQSTVNGAAGGLGFTLAIVLFASVRERVNRSDCPECFKGFPIALITTNCAVLGVVLVNVQEGYNFLFSVLNGTFGGLGFTLAIVLFASVRERVNKTDCPECFKGFPIALIAAGLLALAFMGFSGLSIT